MTIEDDDDGVQYCDYDLDMGINVVFPKGNEL